MVTPTFRYRAPDGTEVDTPIENLPSKTLTSMHQEVAQRLLIETFTLIALEDECARRNIDVPPAPDRLQRWIEEARSIKAMLAKRQAAAEASV